MAELPSAPGSYLLLMRLPHAASIQVGRLGSFDFAPGWYAYAGSACGPGGLRARLGRYLRETVRQHWHIDCFRRQAELCEIFYAIGGDRLECTWSQRLAAAPGAAIPVFGFGSSDCTRGCAAHLIRLVDVAGAAAASGWTRTALTRGDWNISSLKP